MRDKYPGQNMETLYKYANNIKKKTLIWKENIHKADKINRRGDLKPSSPPQRWGKIGIIKNTEHKKVDWDALSYATEKATRNRLIWATCLSAKEIPTGKLIHSRGLFPTPACPRNCGHAKEYMPNTFKCKKRDDTWENLKKKLVIWGIKNRAEHNLIPVLIHGISL